MTRTETERFEKITGGRGRGRETAGVAERRMGERGGRLGGRGAAGSQNNTESIPPFYFQPVCTI